LLENGPFSGWRVKAAVRGKVKEKRRNGRNLGSAMCSAAGIASRDLVIERCFAEN
jgi:hypothetical protein